MSLYLKGNTLSAALQSSEEVECENRGETTDNIDDGIRDDDEASQYNDDGGKTRVGMCSVLF